MRTTTRKLSQLQLRPAQTCAACVAVAQLCTPRTHHSRILVLLDVSEDMLNVFWVHAKALRTLALSRAMPPVLF